MDDDDVPIALSRAAARSSVASAARSNPPVDPRHHQRGSSFDWSSARPLSYAASPSLGARRDSAYSDFFAEGGKGRSSVDLLPGGGGAAEKDPLQRAENRVSKPVHAGDWLPGEAQQLREQERATKRRYKVLRWRRACFGWFGRPSHQCCGLVLTWRWLVFVAVRWT